MAIRKLNREEISLTERNIKRHEQHTIFLKYDLHILEKKILDWGIIEDNYKEGLNKEKQKIVDLAKIDAKTPLDTHRKEVAQYQLDNMEIFENKYKNEIRKERLKIEQGIVQIKQIIKENDMLISTGKNQIANGVEMKEEPKPEPVNEE